MLRQAADVDPDPLRLVEPANPLGGQDRDHARRESAVGDDREALRRGGGVELLLLEDDLGVAAEVAEMAAALDGERRHRAVEVVRQGAHHRVVAGHDLPHGGVIGTVELLQDQLVAAYPLQERREAIDLQVGEGHLGDAVAVEEIVGARRSLQSSPENEHLHSGVQPMHKVLK